MYQDPNGFGFFSSGTSYDYYIQKGSGFAEVGSRIDNEEIEYFKDCPTLYKKIKNKTFARNNIPQIVKFYNNQCQ